MYVQGLMFSAVEEERESKESEYFWHRLLLLGSSFAAKMGIISDTSKENLFFCIMRHNIIKKSFAGNPTNPTHIS